MKAANKTIGNQIRRFEEVGVSLAMIKRVVISSRV
ncbi:hypothetical protein ES702_01472 [subsurface metagenome]